MLKKHSSLFTGIGGFDLAASWMGWENVFSCEKNPFCRKILEHYWPQTKHYEDIFELQATQYLGKLDILSGGFPCQPFSQAGQRKGIQDERYLFPETCRIIKEARPRWIVLENVTGLFTILEPDSLSQMEIEAVELFCEDDRQPTNKTIIRLQRRVIGSIIREIGEAGYVLPQLQDGTPVVLCIPAAAVGAPHQRDRVWFVAYSDSHGKEQYGSNPETGQGETATKGQKERKGDWGTDFFNGLSDLSRYDSTVDGSGQAKPDHAFRNPGNAFESTAHQGTGFGYKIPSWKHWPSESPFFSGVDGISSELDGISFSVWQQESTRAYGNAIVPQVAYEIFRAIEAVGI
ncbi:DNA cytosine methyltransferase [Sphingobacterium thalpophilum]|uniref:DNA cytosine methyltransferase n=1 Tax=Sphingobacterium thalpophilum TaxID=259 RepID=UPI0024A79334|nr:DNA (cytosine-5-)-methyltransferase [Sphingobacterium thalpophilum]